MGRDIGGALLVFAVLLGSSQPTLMRDTSLATPHQVQTSQKPDQAEEKIRVNSNLVVLWVTVKDHSGNLVPDLRREEFRVFDDTAEQKVEVFREEGIPLSLVILIDNDLKWKEGTEMVKSLGAVIGGLSAIDEASVCRFDMQFYPGEDFTASTDTLLAELKEAQKAATPTPEYVPQPLLCGTNSTSGSPCIAAPTNPGARPSKALDDAVYSAAELLEGRGREHRKIILLISDGVAEPKLNRKTNEQVIETLLRNNISVFSLALGSESAKGKFGRLASYADKSGGDIYYGKKSSEIEELYERITEEARHGYTVAYVPEGTSANSGYHKVKVQVAREGLIVETREGYYATSMENNPKK